MMFCGTAASWLLGIAVAEAKPVARRARAEIELKRILAE